MVIRPPGPIVERAIQQPPPEKAVVRIVVNDHGTRVVRIEHVIDPHWPGRIGNRVRNIHSRAVSAAAGPRDGGRCDLVRGRVHGGTGSIAWRVWPRELGVLEAGEFLFAGFLFPGASSGVVEREARRPAAVVLRRLPAADQDAVAREDLNLRRHINDVQQIVSIDGDGPRPKQPAGRAARQAPNFFERAGLGRVSADAAGG